MSGRRRARRFPLLSGPLLALGILVAAGAWALLVIAAIDFGGTAVSGNGAAWLFTVAAGLGAAVCLLLVLILLARVLALRRARRERRRRPAHHRAP